MYRMLKLLLFASFLLGGVISDTIKVSPSDNVQKAFDTCKPGDTIILEDGIYLQDMITKVDGEPSKRITVKGSRDAIIKGSGDNDRIFEINHSYYTLDGFTIDGHHGDGNKESDYIDKCLFVLGTNKPELIRDHRGEYLSSLDGLIVKNMLLQNSGGETMRLRSFITNAEIYGNKFYRAGIHAILGGLKKSKNAEQVYVGTSSNQHYDGKNSKSGPDLTRYIWIHHNDFSGSSSEGVEASKEGTEYVLVEYNEITDQVDPESAGVGIRSDNVIVRYNSIMNTEGAGVRIGGHVVDGRTYGKLNQIYGNTFSNTKYGTFKIQTDPQTVICGNICKESCLSKGDLGDAYHPEEECKDVPEVDWLKNRDGSLETKPMLMIDSSEDYEESSKKVSLSIDKGSKCFPIKIKKIEASSEQRGNSAQNAVDGKAVSRWSALGQDEWLEIDLGNSKSINALEMAFFKGDERKQLFSVYIDGDLVLSDVNSSGKTLGLERFPIDEKKGSEVTIYGKGNSENDWNSITEIVLCGPRQDKDEHDIEEDSNDCENITNLDIEAVSGSTDDGNEPKNVIDGNMKTYFSSNPTEGEAYISLVLSDPSYVEDISISFYSGDKRVTTFDIIVRKKSNNKNERWEWKEILTDKTSIVGNGLNSYDIKTKDVKEIKIVGYGSKYLDGSLSTNWLSVTQVNVSGC